MHAIDTSSPTLLGLLWSNRRRFAPGLAYAFARIVSIAPLPLIFKRIIDHDMPRRDLHGIAMMSALTVVLLLLHQWLSVKGAKRLGISVTHVILGLRAQIFDKIQYLSFTYLDRQKTGKLLAKYAFDTQKVEAVAMPILNWFLPDSLRSILTLVVLVAIDWRLSVIVLMTLPVMIFMRSYYFEPLRRKNEANRVAQEQFTGTATEYLGALRLVRSYGREQRAREHLDRSNEEVARSRVELIGLSSSFAAFSFGTIQFLSLVVVAGGAILSIFGHVTPGTVFAFYAGLAPLVQPIQMFSQISDQFFLGREAYASIRELLDEPATEQWHGTRRLDTIRGRIEFDRVTFRYPEADHDALCDFSLTIEPGQRVALVGASGAGKSTAASLLLGLYHASGGTIRIDGVPQAELDMRWLRRRTALVMQESVLLSGSIADNIRFARDDASDQQVREAARLAQADEFIDALPQGMQTVVGERGVMLSGGQRQRLSIARALLRDPAILILDEPTSALDYQSERLIQTALDELARGRTVMTIAHRLSTIQTADLVVVLEGGRIVEQGTCAELRARDGYFRRMWSLQDPAAVASDDQTATPAA